ncbi:hypothetical protein ACI2LF_11590 [Kribbella sp. NPDC020789]
MTRRPPAERTLPDPDRMLRQILSEQPPVRRRRGLLVPAIAAAAVAAVVAAALIVPSTLHSGEPDVKPAAQPAEIDLDLGPLSKAEIATFLKHCWFWNGTSQKVVHTTKVKTSWGDGEEWTLAMIGHSDGGNGVKGGNNRVTGCSGRPHGRTDVPIHEQGFRLENFITTTSPMRYDDSFRPNEGTPANLQYGKLLTSSWIRVPATVQRARQRLVADGQATPWFASRAQDGLVYLQASMDAPAHSAALRVETQFLDAAGTPIRIPGSNGLTSSAPVSAWYQAR